MLGAEAVEATDSPFAFFALTVKVYGVPFVNPEIVKGDEAPETVLPSFDVTVYSVIADPPLFAGAVNEITTLSFPDATALIVGAFGTVDGVADKDALDRTEVPMPFVAVTLKVYATPFVRPLTEHVWLGAVLVQLPATLFSGVYAVTV